MPTMHDVPVNALIEEVAKDLQKVDAIKAPEWAEYAKTGVHKERPPAREDWWFMRCAAVLRSVRRLGPVGVNKLRTKYGGRKRRGHKTEHFYKGSGNVLRKALQQLEAAGLIKKGEKGVHKGRIITPQGVSLIDKAAVRLYKPRDKAPKEEKKEAPKPEAKPKEEKVKEQKAEQPKEEAKPEAPKAEQPKAPAEEKQEKAPEAAAPSQ
jgi:small subunit ribosomal protein S19e